MISGRSLELFFVDGNPEGMLTAEVFNWTGHVLRIPKIRLAEGLRRSEARQTGVYILVGEDEIGPLAYIGEAENMADRLRQHSSQKEWWDEAVLVTTAGDSLHKAHVKYLESRLVELAKAAGNIRLENGNIPPRSSLNEAATSNMESFLDTLQIVLPAIRVDLLQDKRRPDTSGVRENNAAALTLVLSAPRRNLTATAQIIDGEVVVLAGSKITTDWVGNRKYQVNYQKKHADLLASDVVSVADEMSVFNKNYAFSSLSTAAAVILGRSANGRTEWKLATDGRSYADWEDAQLSDASGENAE